jgi:hypothetical protein
MAAGRPRASIRRNPMRRRRERADAVRKQTGGVN